MFPSSTISRRCGAGALLLGLLILGGCARQRGPELAPLPPTGEGPAAGRAITETPAPPDLPEGAGLADYLSYAQEHHPAIRAAHFRWQAAREQVPQARSLPDPSLSLGYESMDRQRSVGVMQEFPFPGKRGLRAGVAEAGARVAQQELEIQRRAVLRDVGEAFAEYAYARRSAEVIAQNVELARQLEQAALARVRAGAPQAEVLRAQIELSRLEDELRSAQDLQRPAAARLNAALGRPAASPLPAPAVEQSESPRAGDEELLARLHAASPELESLRQEAEQARRAVDLARREVFPDVGVGAQYMRNRMEDGVGLMLSVNIPLWQGRYRAAIREARNELYAASHALLDRHNALQAELEMALFGLRDAERRIVLHRQTLLPRAEQTLNAAEAAYRAGNVDFFALNEAHRLRLEFQLALARAQADRALRLAEIEALVGGTMISPTSPTSEVSP